MKRLALVAAVLLLGSGCRAPMPNWNMIGPYGATRVPPPPTGGYGTPQPYYAPAPGTAPTTIAPTSTPVGTGFRPSTSNRWSNIDDPAVGPIAKLDTWAPTRTPTSNTRVVDLRDADVALASHEVAAPRVPSTVVVEHTGPIRILSSDGTATVSEPPRLRGMVVNDMTHAAEPQTFVPSGRVVDISQLPDSPVERSAQGASATSSSSSTAARQASNSGWKTRTTTLRVAGS